MDELVLRDLADRFLLPFFSGAKIEEKAKPSVRHHQLVAITGPCSIAFKVEASDDYRLVISRPQAFVKSSKDRIPERTVIESFVEALIEIKDHVGTEYIDDLLAGFQRRVIARALVANAPKDKKAAWRSTILNAIDQLSDWSSRLYEGAPVSAALGLRHVNIDQPGRRPDMRAVAKHDFGAVLSNGHDTILTFTLNEGELLGHEALELKKDLPSYCPLRQAQVAEWTTKHERRIALSLNRLGEILIYHDHQMVFARRSGRWNFMTHIPVVTQMNLPRKTEIRKKNTKPALMHLLLGQEHVLVLSRSENQTIGKKLYRQTTV